MSACLPQGSMRDGPANVRAISEVGNHVPGGTRLRLAPAARRFGIAGGRDRGRPPVGRIPVGRRGTKEYRPAEALALIAADRDHRALVCPSCGAAAIERRPRRSSQEGGHITLRCATCGRSAVYLSRRRHSPISGGPRQHRLRSPPPFVTSPRPADSSRSATFAALLHGLHRPDRLRDRSAAAAQLRSAAAGGRRRHRFRRRLFLAHAVPAGALVGKAERPHRPAAGDPGRTGRQRHVLPAVRLRRQLLDAAALPHDRGRDGGDGQRGAGLPGRCHPAGAAGQGDGPDRRRLRTRLRRGAGDRRPDQPVRRGGAGAGRRGAVTRPTSRWPGSACRKRGCTSPGKRPRRERSTGGCSWHPTRCSCFPPSPSR